MVPGRKPVPVRSDTASAGREPSATAVADSGADSAAVASADSTEQYLTAEREQSVVLTPPGQVGIVTPLPAGSRFVFTRDSLDWSGAVTVGDLVARVPGTYLWRGGGLGRPELPNFEGRGAASVSYEVDGVPYLPVGPDSTAVDPALFPLSILQRVEIDRWPGKLRVRLYTWQHDRLAPHSRIGFSKGTNNLARYQAALEREYRSGFGFGLAADYLDVPTLSGSSSASRNTTVWVQGSWKVSPHVGLVAQSLSGHPVRQAFIAAGDSLGAAYNGRRSDLLLRGYYQQREDGLGPRLDLLVARTSWTGEGFSQRVTQAGAVAALRGPTLGGALQGFYRSRWTPADFRATLGWTPVTVFAADLEADYQRHSGSRTSRWAAARLGLHLPLGLLLDASARIGRVVAAPEVAADTAQPVRDFELGAGFESRRLGFRAAYVRTSAFAPPAFQPFLQIDSLAQIPRSNWITLSGHASPTTWLEFTGTYANPRGGGVQGMPPQHFIGTGAIHSRFLRTFPSGIFELKLQGSVEHWSNGVIGLDAVGAPVGLPSATFFRSLIELRLGGLVFYVNQVNLSRSQRAYVPGFPIPGLGNEIGFHWDFLN